jgi:hypothetical protein
MVGAHWARGEHHGVLLPGKTTRVTITARQARIRCLADARDACPGFSLIIRW